MPTRRARGGQAGDRQAVRDRVLLAVLPNTVFDGWTRKAFDDAVRHGDVDETDLLRAFPDGVAHALDHFADWADRETMAAVQAERESFEALRVRDKVARAVRLRLEILEPHREALRRALAWYALPGRQPDAARITWRTADVIWRLAGDTATDFNHYTKRGLLTGVWVSTLVFWLADRSEGYEATWRFLDRRIDEVLRVGRRLGGLSRLGDLAEAPFRLAARVRARGGSRPPEGEMAG